MHRDIKPENLLFRSETSFDDIVIVDFGLGDYENLTDYLFKRFKFNKLNFLFL